MRNASTTVRLTVVAVIVLAALAGVLVAHLWRISPLVWVCWLPVLLVVLFYVALFAWMHKKIA